GGEGPPDSSGKDVKYVRRIHYSTFGRKIITPCPSRIDGEKPGVYDVDIIASAFLAIPKHIYYSIGGFDPYFYYVGEDRDICFRLKEKGYRLVVRPDTRAIHFSTKTGNRFKAQTYITWIIYYLNKCLEAEIKRKKVMGGIMWMAANFWIIPFFYFFTNPFMKSKQILERKNIDFLSPAQMEEYYLLQLRKQLKERLGFPVRFPLPPPKNIVLFVTSKCNGLCDHCFLPGISKSQNDIEVKNIIGLIKQLKAPIQLILTGGEPFLRDDIEEVIGRLMEQKQIKSLFITSNASFPEKIELVFENICKSCVKPLYLQISLDGFEKTHNSIRKIPDGFKKAIDTCERLKRLKRKYPYLSFIVNISIMKSNLSEIEELVNYLEKNEYPSKLTPIRGNSFSTFNVPGEILNPEYNPRQDVSPTIMEIKGLLKAIEERHPTYFGALQKIRLKLMLDTLNLKKRQIPCYAGFDEAVIYSDGSIGFCEQVVPYGRLSKWNWDISRSWNSKEAMEHRLKLLSCACIHGCNIVPSIKRNITKGNLLFKVLNSTLSRWEDILGD
ncbi:MAG: radical SAM protein, partial [Candidatus Altiarchaeota archaeon]|nr:radical SAM protein [Candidatus Altiarchaeota archaeon]